VGVEFTVAGIVAGAADRRFQQLVRRVRRPERDRHKPERLTDAEALEWAIWLIESRYLDVVSAAVKEPVYQVIECRRSSDGQSWAVGVEYLRVGTFDVEFGEGDVGPIGNATVTWHPPTRALAVPSAESLHEKDGIVSHRIDGLRARIVFGLPWTRNR
jgi:hypothetical protein